MGDKVSNKTLSDLITGRQGYDRGTNVARAFVGQGMGLGWGDEAEAWLRSKLGEGTYEQNLPQIRKEYGTYAKEHPLEAFGLEFTGGVAPTVAAMYLPGGQPAAQSSASRNLLKLAALGGVTGAIAGAGAAEDDKVAGGIAGGGLGAGLGVGAPLALRGSSAVLKWLAERAFPTEKAASKYAARKVLQALGQEKMTPQQIEQVMAADRAKNVPSVVANVSPALSDLAEATAQRTGAGARKIETALGAQSTGAKERVYGQVVKGLQPGDFYADEQRMVEALRRKAGTMYDDAYAFGAVDDPRITEVLKDPTFAGFFQKAKAIADKEALAAKMRGDDPSKYKLPEIYKLTKDAQGNTVVELTQIPDVRTLDYMKRGIDATIEAGFKGEGMSTAEASALRDLRKQFVNAIDEATGGAQSPYKQARQAYAGDIEILDAMRTGMKDFGKLDHEQVANLIAGMSQAEKEAFRTGVVRDIYSKIMDPANNFNAANKIIGSPEMQAKLQPLFDSPAKFNLFQAALERESQLFKQSNKVLGGSQTGKRAQMRESLESGTEAGQAVADALRGSFWSSLGNLASRAATNTKMTDDMADKLATMLMSKDPHEVAAVVKLLEQQAASDAPKAFRASALEKAVTTGTPAAIWSPPAGEAEVEAPRPETLQRVLPDIESEAPPASKAQDELRALPPLE